MKYTVTVMEFHGEDDIVRNSHCRATWHVYEGVSHPKATRICLHHAKRGVKRFGGSLDKSNFGMRGGRFPESYRTAVITAAS